MPPVDQRNASRCSLILPVVRRGEAIIKERLQGAARVRPLISYRTCSYSLDRAGRLRLAAGSATER